eukprot:scaffold298661_cov44-Prasinocladus_malaysianus.AAC.1
MRVSTACDAYTAQASRGNVEASRSLWPGQTGRPSGGHRRQRAEKLLLLLFGLGCVVTSLCQSPGMCPYAPRPRCC